MEKTEELYDLCVFKGCPNEAYSWGRPLLPFPNITNPTFKIWLENCGNKSILSRSDLQIHKFGLCSDHFTPDSFCDEEKRKLRRDAVPEAYSPSFKRPHYSVRSNDRIYDHNYALVTNEMTEILHDYGQRLQCPWRRYNVSYSRVGPTSNNANVNNNINNNNVIKKKNESKTNSGSPRPKRERSLAKTYAKESLNFDKNDEKVTKASSPVESFVNKGSEGVKNACRLTPGSKNTSSMGLNSDSNSTQGILGGEKLSCTIGGGNRIQGSNSKIGGLVLNNGEVGILQETNEELRTQNKLLKKLNGLLKLKMKRFEDRNKMLKTSLEKVSSVDGFLDLHRCYNLDIRNLIRGEIHKCKMPSLGNNDKKME